MIVMEGSSPLCGTNTKGWWEIRQPLTTPLMTASFMEGPVVVAEEGDTADIDDSPLSDHGKDL